MVDGACAATEWRNSGLCPVASGDEQSDHDLWSRRFELLVHAFYSTAQNITNTRAVRAISSMDLRYVEERVRKGTGEDLSPLFTPFCIHMMAQLFMSTVIKSRHFLMWTRRTKIFNGTRDALANPRALKRCPADRVFALGYLQRGAR